MKARSIYLRAFLLCLVRLAVVFIPATLSAHEAGGDGTQSHHHRANPEITRRLVNYTLPSVELVRDDGKTVTLSDELNDGRLVVLNFIYTSCTAVCPMSSHVLSQLQGKLGPNLAKVHLVSISIDPEQDTPANLLKYARKFAAGPQWQHYTGTRVASLSVQRSFDAYRGDKMNHAPVTFVRDNPDHPWLRVDGFATADDLLADINKALAGP
jgi:protein SCO1/2